ncbi:MAG TPA: MoaD/ThiS family protein [Pedococcus sp.]|nr:MoaD/ThiS family protein [Pedococcus sp.]
MVLARGGGMPGGEQASVGVTVRYWAGARAAAGVDEDAFDHCPTVESVTAAVVALHPGLEPIVRVSTLLLDGHAVTSQTSLSPGALLEVLPPFAGG